LSWINSKFARSAALVALVSAGTAQAGTIVVRSNLAKLYPTGKVLPDGAVITLKAGESITILDGKGTRELKGAGTFKTVVGGGATQETRVKMILGNQGKRVARTGAIRGTATKPKPTSIWQADISSSGTVCIADPNGFAAWRPNADAAGNFTVTRVSDGKSVPLIFGEKVATTLWPTAELPVTPGATYRISGDGMPMPTTVRFVTMGEAPTGLETTVSEMMAKGCTGQYELLIDMVSVTDEAPKTAGL